MLTQYCAAAAPAFPSRRQRTSVTEDHQSIIPHGCVAMIPLLDTLEPSHCAISEDKAFYVRVDVVTTPATAAAAVCGSRTQRTTRILAQ